MPSKAEHLQNHVEKEDERLDVLLAALAVLLGKMFRRYFKHVKASLVDVAKGNLHHALHTTHAQTVANQLEQHLHDAGLAEFHKSFNDAFEAVAEDAVKIYGVMGHDDTLDGVDLGALRSIAEENQKTLARDLENRLISSVALSLLGLAATGGTIAKAMESISSLSDSAPTAPITRLVDDQLATMSRTVRLMKGKAFGFEYFVFIGPLDQRTCPRCLTILVAHPHGVPGTFTYDEIVSLAQDLYPTLPPLGKPHPNCRHTWVGVKDLEEARLWSENTKDHRLVPSPLNFVPSYPNAENGA